MKKIFFFVLLFFIPLSLNAEDINELKVINPGINTKNINGISSLNTNDLFSGAGVYSLGFEFPKGPKALSPSLSLSYNSYSTDAFSPYGYAWNMGLPSISRSSKKGIIGIYDRNEFVANGEELVLVNEEGNLYKSKYTNNLNKYYFENNSWRIIDSKGNTYYYGTDNNSKLVDPNNTNKVFSWNLNKIVDINGNEIIYNYFKNKNQVYIDNIKYAGELYKIQFNYLDKAKSLSSYRTQFEVKTSKLLSSVIFYTNNSEVKRYELNYDDKDSVYSHLISFEEKTGSNTKSKVEFQYGKGKDIHLLKTIENNSGLKIDFEYKPSIFYKDENGNNLNPKLPFNMKTLNKISYLDNVTGITNTETFEYAEGAFYYDPLDLYGREYAGFGKVTKTDILGRKEIYYFHQGKNSKDNPELGEFEDHISKKGRIFRKEMYDNSGNLIKTEVTKWIHELKGNDRWRILKDRETKNLINGENITSSAIEYSYDEYSNLIEKIEYGEVSLLNEKGDFNDIKEDKKISKLTYSNNINKNLFGFISSQKLFDFDNNLSYKKEILYDNLSIGNVDFGNPTNIKTYETETKFVEEKNEYNSKGLLVKQINPKGFGTSYTYDSYGIYPISVTNAKGFTENYEYNYVSGKPSKVVNINGLETLYSYDNFGRLLSEKLKSDNEYEIKQIVYNDLSVPNSITQILYFDKNETNSQNIKIYLNGLGNEVQTKKSYKDKYITTKVEYDAIGNKIYTTYPTFENTSNYTVLNKQTEFGDNYEYDSLKRVTKISNKTGDIVYDYDNLDFTITNQRGISSNYEYDIFGNLVKVTEPGNFETKYSYNTLGQLTKIVDSQNNLRNIIYDLSGKRLEIEDLHKLSDTNFGSRKYEYDVNGNIVKYTTMSDDDIVYTYDNLDRLKTESFGTNITNYTYDIGSNAKGLLSSYTKGDYSENYTYDIYGNLTSENKNYGSDNYTNSYIYNLAGQKLSDTYPDNKQTNYIYENGILIGVNYDGTELVKNVEYNPALKISSLKYGNDAITKNIFDYENGYRLTQRGLNFGNNQYGLTNYTFDNLGNITNLKEQGNIPDFQKDILYNYDDLNRLLEAKYSDTEKYNYTYDSLGNILSNSVLGDYIYIDNGRNNPHAVTKVGNIDYSYDNNGNISAYSNSGTTTKTLNYNAKDELISFSDNNGNATNYKYNNAGIRVEKSSNNGLSRYINKDYEIQVEGSGTGAITTTSKYIYFLSKKLATVETKAGAEKIIYHHEDHLGGGNIDLSSTGGLLQVVDYLPFGQIKTKQNYSDFKNKYLFGGKEQDSESDLQYFEARYYDNGIGRFESIDRVFWEVGGTKRGLRVMYNPQQLNSYSYVANNPLKYMDPSGEELKEYFDRGMTGLTVLFTTPGIRAFSCKDEGYRYLSDFLGYSLIGTREIVYNEGSDYINSLKETNDYKKLLKDIKTEVLNGKLNYSSSKRSTETFTIVTLGKYNYSVNAVKKNNYYDVSIKITDIFDFNEIKDFSTFRNKGLHILHKANEYGILTPFNLEININEKIYEEQNDENNHDSSESNTEDTD